MAVLATAPAALAQQSISKVNGSISADTGQSYGDLETVNGSIRIDDGASVRDAGTVNGAIRAGADIQVDSLSTVNGGIRVAENARIAGDVSTVNGGIFIDRGGDIGGSIETVNGSIGLVDTDLAGGIETVSGDVTVGAGSHVRGGIRYHKPGMRWFSMKRSTPRVIIGPDARVDGELVFEHEVSLHVHRSAQIGPVTGATAVRFDGATPQER
ncbi:MAG: hypothetical protein KY442_07140 [Proteobacteria bacterium]|nr:hypothetical protein [Pseudomonadota bacterium]